MLKLYESQRKRPYYRQRRNLKTHSFISTLRLPSTLIRHENGTFRNGGIWKRRLCIFVWTENDDVRITTWFSPAAGCQNNSRGDATLCGTMLVLICFWNFIPLKRAKISHMTDNKIPVADLRGGARGLAPTDFGWKKKKWQLKEEKPAEQVS